LPGYRVRDGVLVLERDTATIQVRLWPPEAFSKARGSTEYRPCRAGNVVRLDKILDHLTGRQQLLQLFPPRGEEGRGDRFAALRSAVAQIPKPILNSVLRFPDQHMALLKLAEAGGQPALQLMESCAALGYMVATQRSFTRKTRPASELVLEKRPALAAHLGFPGNKSTVRVLTRARRETLNVNALKQLRELLLNESHAAWLRHLRRINTATILLMSGPFAENLEFDFINEVSMLSRKAAKSLLRTAADLDRMLGLLGNRPERRFRTVRQFVQLHDDIAAMLHDANIAKADNLEALRFPTPPIPDVDTDDVAIAGVTHAAALFQLGKRFRNCVFSLLGKAVAENHRVQPRFFLYEMTRPSKATIEIILNSSTGKYELGAVKAPMNRTASKKAVEATLHWLAENGHTGTLRKPARTAQPRTEPPRQRPVRQEPQQREYQPVETQRPPPNIPVDELILLLDSDSPVVRSGSMMALPSSLRSDPRVVRALLRRLHMDWNFNIRRQAAERLGELGDESVIEPMRDAARALGDDRRELKRAIAAAVVRLEIGREE
jgi:hypothetical protein